MRPFNIISEGPEGDRCRDRVQQCCLNVISHQKLFFQGKKKFSKFCKKANCIIVSRYCQLSYIVTGKLLATHFLIFVLFHKNMELG